MIMINQGLHCYMRLLEKMASQLDYDLEEKVGSFSKVLLYEYSQSGLSSILY